MSVNEFDGQKAKIPLSCVLNETIRSALRGTERITGRIENRTTVWMCQYLARQQIITGPHTEVPSALSSLNINHWPLKSGTGTWLSEGKFMCKQGFP